MKKIRTFCVSVVFLFGISGGANALLVADFTTDPTGISPFAGTIPVPGVKSTTRTPSGTFTDQLLFDVAIVANLLEGTLASPTGFLGGAFATVKLFQALAPVGATDPPAFVVGAFSGADFILASFASNIFGNDVYSLTATLSGIPTRYFIEVSATTSGVGSYSVQLTTSVVPLPPAAVLFLSALAGLVGFSRIRRRKAVTT